MPTCKECRYFIQGKGHSGRCEKWPYVRTKWGTIAKINGEPRPLIIYWSHNACKTFEKKKNTEEKT